MKNETRLTLIIALVGLAFFVIELGLYLYFGKRIHSGVALETFFAGMAFGRLSMSSHP